MIVDFNGETVSYNFRPCATIEKDRVVLDLDKLNYDLVQEFRNDAHAFVSVLRAHGHCTSVHVIMPSFEDKILFLRQDFREMGFTILENPGTLQESQ